MKHIPWSEEEIRTIRQSYPDLGPAATALLLPRRSMNSVRTKAQELGVQTSKKARREISTAAARRANEEILRRKQANAIRAELFPEYECASDIFQVGYRVARKLGVLDQYVRCAA